ncbi:MAG: protein TolR [Deltaproteobacteria bacterium]|nr:protein TolR [Deltaproteobacteria bacterium]MBW2098174.1 protein TolR [Deltaproteobacteria bacterium]
MTDNPGQRNGKRRYMSEINVTPLVDVVIVLLIIFMVTAPMMTRGLDINLPKTTAKPLPQKNKNIIITVNRKGEIYLNKVAVDEAVLKRHLAEMKKTGQARQVLLKADAAIAYGTVARVMAAIREAGIEDLGLVTQPLKPSKTIHKRSKTEKNVKGDNNRPA